MTNIEKVSAVVGEWASIVLSKALPQVGIPQGSAIGKFMYGMLGIDPASYNLWNELGFLIQPMAQTLIQPMLTQFLGNIPEEQVQEMAMKFADAFVAQAQEKGSVNLFGMEIGAGAFEKLRDALVDSFNKK